MFNWLRAKLKTDPSHSPMPDEYSLPINIINTIEKQNLTMVSQYPENTSSYSNAHYAHEATRFAKRHVDIAYKRVGNDACITVTLRQLSQHKDEFLSQQGDPDGICGGTLTDIQQALVSLDNT